MRLARLIVSVSALALLVWVTDAQSQVVVRLGTIAPERSVWHDALMEIRQQWRTASNGEVELRIYAGGVLGDEDEMVRKMQRRSLDALTISGAGLPLIDEIVSCLNLPLLFDSYEELDHVRDAISDEVERSFEADGYKVLNWAEAGWVHFFAKSPVRTLDDLRAQRLRISTGALSQERLMKQLGFRVVALPATDMLTGLQTGMIEAISAPPLFAMLDRSYQISNYMTVMRFAPLNAATVITLQTWQRIPERYRDGLLAAARRSAENLRDGVRAAERGAIAEMAARGLNLVELDAVQLAEWHQALRAVYPELTCAREHPALFNRVMSLQGETVRVEP